MKVKLKIKQLTEAEKQAGQERLRNAVQRGIEQGFGQPIKRAQTYGTASEGLYVYVSEGMKAHITQLAQLEQRSISSICKELLEVALGLVETPEEAAASEAIVQRAQNPRDDGDIAALTLDDFSRSTGGLAEIELPRPTTEDINHGRFDPFTQRWHPDWDRKNNKWRK